MIIDVHYHFYPAITEKRMAHTIKYAIGAAEKMGRKPDPDALFKTAMETWPNPTGEQLIRQMDEAGIDIRIICTVDNSDMEGNTREVMQQGNRVMAGAAQACPDRILALAGIDPRRPEAPEMMKQCFEEFGVRGLKYHPDHGYDPGGKDSYRVLEIVAENKGVLLTHTGPLIPPARNKFVEPLLLTDLAVDFPEIKVIAAHMGGAVDWRSWASLASRQPGLYGDLAARQPYAFSQFELFCREFRSLLDFAGASKVLFGTDDPIYNTVVPTRDWIRRLKDLSTEAPEGVRFEEAEVEAILGGNAAKVFNLRESP
jgi:predicted TIM-barrel fold metal-dependent hydrolase